MGDFTKVEVHFKDGDGVARVAEVRRGSKGVKAIFLHGSEADFVITSRRTGKVIRRQDIKSVPKGVKLLPSRPGLARIGPGKVCYLENGILKCWSPT